MTDGTDERTNVERGNLDVRENSRENFFVFFFFFFLLRLLLHPFRNQRDGKLD